MIKCKKCGKETGPAFGLCSDCITKEDVENKLTEAELQLIGFALACYLEDAERKFKRNTQAMKQVHEIERITYTKIIPNSWSGPKPAYWESK